MSEMTAVHDDFDAFYASGVESLVRQLYALTGDLGDARDVAQEAYARAWQRWSKVSTYDQPQAWVRTVAFRLAISHWRKKRSSREAWERHGADGHAPDVSPDLVVLVEALRRLPVEQRRVLVLHHMADRSVEDIAAEMERPVGTVKSWLSRGRSALADALRDGGQEARS